MRVVHVVSKLIGKVIYICIAIHLEVEVKAVNNIVTKGSRAGVSLGLRAKGLPYLFSSFNCFALGLEFVVAAAATDRDEDLLVVGVLTFLNSLEEIRARSKYIGVWVEAAALIAKVRRDPTIIRIPE